MSLILVGGASGNVGSALLKELRQSGRPARAAYHDPSRTGRALAAGEDAVTLDLSRPETLPPALEGVDAVFLLGAMGPDQTTQELNLVEAAVAAGIRRLVKLSVWRCDEELTPIARLHRPVERALEASDLAVTLLRPNFYMQTFSRQMGPSIRERSLFAQPALEVPISFVDAADVASVAARVLTSEGHEGRVHDITGPEALTYAQAAGVMTSVLGRPIRYVALGDEEARARMLERGLPRFHADALIDVTRAYRQGGAERVTQTVRDLTGRDPIDLARFVSNHRDAFA
ncbi:MAG TPA: NAD(P)H-binding protein [Candidatus Dormibacteraeota bacterium]|jgi:uncharacterized protein YbjT (DUF2867 family)|nr:NAD(P)H-binding protein [Candidatus Dormibacteraeota bacterium]